MSHSFGLRRKRKKKKKKKENRKQELATGKT